MAFNLFPQTDFRQMDLNYVLEVSKQAAANLEEYAADKEQVVATQAAAERALAAAQEDIETARQAAASASEDAQTASGAAGTATQAAASAEQDAQTASAAAERAEQVQESIPADYTDLSNQVSELKSDLNGVNEWVGYESVNPALPDGIKTANYEANYYKFKYVNPNVIIGYVRSGGGAFRPQCRYGYASLALSDVALDLNDIGGQTFLELSSVLTTNDYAASGTRFQVYFCNDELSVTKNVDVILPLGSADLKVDLTALAADNNIDISTYHNLAIVGIDANNITYIGDYACTVTVHGVTKSQGTSLMEKVEDNQNAIAELQANVNKLTLSNPIRFKPLIDHLFVTKVGNNITIPSESVYHVRLSRALGFDVIEANIWLTSDNVPFVHHLASGGKFGNYFHHADNATDISDIVASTVTWDWIAENVRYNSSIPKYRTRPCTLVEFLSECRQQNIIPFASSGRSEYVEVVKGIMGEDNYIAYQGVRDTNPTAIICHWLSYTTKEEIVNYCESVGTPFIYGMANPDSFSEAELKEIIEVLHEKGYLIGTGYQDVNWYKYSYLGFDTNSGIRQINRIDKGNLVNLNSILGFDDWTYTNANATDQGLQFSSDGTILPNIDTYTTGVYAIDLQVDFTGTISVPGKGEWSGPQTITSDGKPFFMATLIINGVPDITISVSNGTLIKDITYKVSKI